MPLMAWNENLSVGIAVIDDDHKKLLAMINDLYDGIQVGRGKDALGTVLDGLVTYTKTHFAREEKFFAQTSYGDAEVHKREHDALTKQVIDVQAKYNAGSTATLSLEVMNFLKNWLVQHIQRSDKKYRTHLTSHGIK